MKCDNISANQEEMKEFADILVKSGRRYCNIIKIRAELALHLEYVGKYHASQYIVVR